MESPSTVTKGIACGIIFLAFVVWQARIYRKSLADFVQDHALGLDRPHSWSDYWPFPHFIKEMLLPLCLGYHFLFRRQEMFHWGGRYQWRRHWVSDRKAFLLTFALPFSFFVLLTILVAIGLIAYAILGSIDSRSQISIGPLCYFLLAVAGVTFAFFLKSCVNAILLGETATWMLYNLLFNGEWSLLPVFRLLFDLVAHESPAWIQVLYTILTLGYALAGALASTFDFRIGSFIDPPA